MDPKSEDGMRTGAGMWRGMAGRRAVHGRGTGAIGAGVGAEGPGTIPAGRRGRAGLVPAMLLPFGLFCLLSLLVWSPISAMAEDAAEIPTDLTVPVRAVLSHESVAAGGAAVLAVIYEVPPDAHIQVNEFLYAAPAEGEPFTLGEATRSATTVFEGEPVHVGRTIAWYPVRLGAGLPAGSRTLKVLAGYQACLEKPVFACFAPVDAELAVACEVVAPGEAVRASDDPLFASMPAAVAAVIAGSAGAGDGGTGDGGAGRPADAGGDAGGVGLGAGGVTPGQDDASGSAASEVAPATLEGKLERALERRSLLAFLLVFLGGLLTSLTPCVYPMIPITISYIGGQAKSRAGGFVLSLFFVLGIAVMYSALGVVAATTGSLFGSAMQSTPVILVVAAVFVAMGASMLGAFDLTLPSSMQSKLQSGPRTGIIGALFMGMVTGIVASPCVGPVLVVLLAGVAKIGSIGLGFLLLFTFALGLGMLFLVIGTFAGALAALPQAGGWMDTVKHVFGVILLAMGIFYLRGLLGPAWTMLIAGAFAIFVGTFTGAFHPLTEEDPPKSRLFRKGLGIVLLLVGAFALLTGTARLAGVSLPAGGGPPASGAAAAGAHPGLDWVMDDAEGMARARAAGRPVLIDFYADWCAACKELDHKTWVDPAVQAEAERFVAIKLDLTERNPANAAKQASYRVPGLPTVIFYDGQGNEVHRFFGFKEAPDVLEIMRGVR